MMDIWIYGYMDIWIYGYMDIWIYGYMDIWIYGHMGVIKNLFQGLNRQQSAPDHI